MTKMLMIACLVAGAACSGPSCASAPLEAAHKPPRSKVPPSMIQRTLTVDDVDRLIWRPGTSATFEPTTIREREVLAKLVPLLVQGARATTPPDPATWQNDAAAAGFRLERWEVGGEVYWALLESPERRRGAGAYVFRVAPAVAGAAASEILLQAPHSYFDVGTGLLAAQLFFFPPAGARPRAFFTNTIHRYQSEPGKKLKQKNSPADVAHNPEHGFATATEAFARAEGGHALVIQLHGFAGRAEDAEDSASAEAKAAPAVEITMVVSAGDKAGSSPRSQALASALGKTFGAGVKRFPEDTRLLGATTNVQARLLRGIPGAEFVHLEMAAELRKTLAADPEQRRALGTILFNTAAGR